jgi:O-antigen ligase
MRFPVRTDFDLLRRRLRERYPFFELYVVFVAMLVLIPHQQIYRNFHYIFLLVPFLLALDRDALRGLAASWVLRWATVFTMLLTASLIWHPPQEPGELARDVRYAVICLSFGVLTAWLFARDPRSDDRFAFWFGLLLAAVAAVSLWTFYSTHPIMTRFAAGLWSNPNTAAVTFGLGAVAIATAPASMVIRSPRAWGNLVIATILMAAIFLTGSRAALLAVAVSLFVSVVLVRAWHLVAAAMLAGSAMAVVGYQFYLRDPGLFLLSRSGGASRLELWSYYWHLAAREPFTGHGIDNEFAFSYRLSDGTVLDSPHNMLLSAFLYGGLFAATAYVALIAAMLLAGARSAWRIGNPMPLAVTLYVLVQGVFESLLPIHNSDWQWIYFWIPIGIVAAAEIRSAGSPERAAVGLD